jgi:hypothetical protein
VVRTKARRRLSCQQAPLRTAGLLSFQCGQACTKTGKFSPQRSDLVAHRIILGIAQPIAQKWVSAGCPRRWPRRYADNSAFWWDIARDNGIRTNPCPLPYRYRPQNLCPSTDGNIRRDGWMPFARAT